MKLDDEELIRLASAVGDGEYAPAFEKAIAELLVVPTLEVEVAPRHYGSGTASFRSVFCTLRSDKIATEVAEEGFVHQDQVGLTILMAQYGPLATWLGDVRRRMYRQIKGGGLVLVNSNSQLDLRKILQSPGEKWRGEIETIAKILNRAGFEILSKDDLFRDLPPHIAARTILPFVTKRPSGLGPRLVFDAIFFWSD